MGIENIVAVDGEQKRLDFAKRMGAEKSVNFKDFRSRSLTLNTVDPSRIRM